MYIYIGLRYLMRRSLLRLIEFAAFFATFEESVCYASSVRQVAPPEGGGGGQEAGEHYLYMIISGSYCREQALTRTEKTRDTWPRAEIYYRSGGSHLSNATCLTLLV